MKFLDLNEGPEDPGIFRAIFLAGGPGSGKSYAARHLSLSSMGLKTIDSDQAFEYLMQKHDMDMSPGSIASDQGQELRDRAKKLTDLKKQGFLSGRLGVVIDGTAKDPNKILNMKRSLENLGYHTALIFVNCFLGSAME
jgi:adenylate kinase family enzyme